MNLGSDGFVEVACLSQLPDRGMLSLEIDDRFVVLVRLGDDVYCLDDVCTHDGGPLGEGELEDHCLVCPRHGAKFDVRTGEAMTMPATESTLVHQVRLDGDRVWVRLGD
jgi:3-phenylpropionate/trans-cinnamate dioxygenase ferredoxin component